LLCTSHFCKHSILSYQTYVIDTITLPFYR
jgi:hypothetical protein